MKNDYARIFKTFEANPDLMTAFRYFVNYNVSLNIPYHNANHMFQMLQHVIGILDDMQNGKNGYDFVLNGGEMFCLIIAAMFHDFNHSGGRFKDFVNIQNAKMGVRGCLETLYPNDVNKQNVLYENIAFIIEATEYPYREDLKVLTPCQRIIRECDCLVCFYDDVITQRIFGLAQELNGNDWYEFLQAELKFASTWMQQGFFTMPYTIAIASKESDGYIAKILDMLYFITDVDLRDKYKQNLQ